MDPHKGNEILKWEPDEDFLKRMGGVQEDETPFQTNNKEAIKIPESITVELPHLFINQNNKEAFHIVVTNFMFSEGKQKEYHCERLARILAEKYPIDKELYSSMEYNFLFPLRYVIRNYDHEFLKVVFNSAVVRERQKKLEEYQYLNVVTEILQTGSDKNDRTGTGTLSLFGTKMKFSLRDNGFPLLTTKKMFWRGIVEELLWFISGSTDANVLTKKGIRIWEEHGSREFLDKCGFKERRVGDLGPVYSYQWRHLGAEYIDCDTNYNGKGIDQLKQCIEMIKNDPTSRRIVMTAWNPVDLPKMVLPPCHSFCQFYVNNGELSCLMYQRSADIGLGVPFNIASYSLLTRLVAHVTNLKPGDFVHVMGDTHIYKNHVEPLKKQLERAPKTFPKLFIKRETTDIDSFTMEDIELVDYEPHPVIKMEMSI